MHRDPSKASGHVGWLGATPRLATASLQVPIAGEQEAFCSGLWDSRGSRGQGLGWVGLWPDAAMLLLGMRNRPCGLASWQHGAGAQQKWDAEQNGVLRFARFSILSQGGTGCSCSRSEPRELLIKRVMSPAVGKKQHMTKISPLSPPVAKADTVANPCGSLKCWKMMGRILPAAHEAASPCNRGDRRLKHAAAN